MEYSGTNLDDKFTSKGVGNAALATGIIGTTLGVLGPHWGLMNNNNVSGNNIQNAELQALAIENAQLKANAATDAKLVDVYTELRKQDKAQDEKISNLNTRVTVLETSAPLREQIVLGQVNSVANSVSTLGSSTQAQINCIQNTLNNITKQVVPISSVCPQPMPAYNAWVAPTTANG